MAFEILIPQKVHDKIMHWVRKSDKEVSGFGKVVRNAETGVFEIVDAYLIEQEVGSAHTDIDDKALSKLMYETKDVSGDLSWWWHSHVNMSVFWSATDKETILELGGNGWIVASVFNKSEEVRSALCYKYAYESDFGKGTSVSMHDEITTTIQLVADLDEVQEWDKEFEKKVKSRPAYDDNWKYNPATGVSKYTGEGSAAKKVPESQVQGLYEEEYWTWGLSGYGLKAEAAALAMPISSYYSILQNGDKDTLFAIEIKLDKAIRSGKLTGEPYAYSAIE